MKDKYEQTQTRHTKVFVQHQPYRQAFKMPHYVVFTGIQGVIQKSQDCLCNFTNCPRICLKLFTYVYHAIPNHMLVSYKFQQLCLYIMVAMVHLGYLSITKPKDICTQSSLLSHRNIKRSTWLIQCIDLLKVSTIMFNALLMTVYPLLINVLVKRR